MEHVENEYNTGVKLKQFADLKNTFSKGKPACSPPYADLSLYRVHGYM